MPRVTNNISQYQERRARLLGATEKAADAEVEARLRIHAERHFTRYSGAILARQALTRIARRDANTGGRVMEERE